MSNPIDEETYGGHASQEPDATSNGNPGRPQSDFQAAEDDQPRDDPSECGSDVGEVVPGTSRRVDAAGSDDPDA